MKTLDDIKIWSVSEFDFDRFLIPVCRKNGNRSKRKKDVLDCYVSFDIETSRLFEIEQSFMYVWMLGVGERDCIIGRTWREFKQCMIEIEHRIEHGQELKIWVHNLAFEFSYLKGIYQFMPDDVFILNGRRVAKCTMMDKITFCCSYVQSNMSLEMLTNKYGVKHKKQSGEDFNYDELRYPWTTLTDDQLRYCVYDVIGLNEAMKKRCEDDGDTLYTIPMTSTGYVRRDVKSEMRSFSWKWLRDCIPAFEIYKLLEECFRGGDTHANRLYSTHIIDNVVSYDRASSYPDVIMNDLFPMGKWYKFEKPSKGWLNIFLDEKKNALIIHATLTRVHLKELGWGSPYIAKHKCRKVINPVIDNGRIVSADLIEVVLCDVDYRIIEDTYDFNIEVHDIYFSKYGKLPTQIRKCTLKYFKGKTELKGVPEKQSEYDKSKALLNSIYGMMAQKPVKQNIDFLVNEELQFNLRSDDERELYDKNTKYAFLSYAWSVWVTAWARFRLYEGIKIAGDYFIYADTDSVKFLYDENVIQGFEAYNKKRIERSLENGAFADDIKGKRHYMGVYELDGSYDRFITLGAKKYAYEKDGELSITVAGVNKKEGAKELKSFGGLEAFRIGTIFKDAGGLEAVYNDHACFEIEREDHKLLITDNVSLKPSTYTIGLTQDYINIIYSSQKYLMRY